MATDTNIEQAFFQEMIKNLKTAKKESGYNASSQIQKAAEIGGVEAARQIIHSPSMSEGFTLLWQNDRLDLSVEALVLSKKYQSLFSQEELSVAKQKLESYGFMIDEGGAGNEDAKHTVKAKLKLHKELEKNKTMIKDAKLNFIKRNNGQLYCEACYTNFERVYGKRGRGFIETHHKTPISQLTEEVQARVEDYAMLCANCHRMIHKQPFITVEQLRAIVKKYSETEE